MSGAICALQSTAGPGAKRAERECQTVEVKQRSAQTCREAHVQMARPDLLLDTSRDKVLAASMPPVPVNSVLSHTAIEFALHASSKFEHYDYHQAAQRIKKLSS